VRRVVERADDLFNRIGILPASPFVYVTFQMRPAFVFCSQPLKPQSVT
jgi:hypothetical protein